jgi:type IV secretory pathway protease TraF
MLRTWIIGAAAICLVVATATEIRFPPRPKLLYNPSASAPIGYYSIGPEETFNIGDQVALYAPDWARKLADERRYLPFDYPLIKTIAGKPGDQICASGDVVSVPNYADITRLSRDSLGRDLPSWDGCLVLSPNEYFVLSAGTEAGLAFGYDSRFFGPVNGETILGTVHYLGNMDRNPSADNSGNIRK